VGGVYGLDGFIIETRCGIFASLRLGVFALKFLMDGGVVWNSYGWRGWSADVADERRFIFICWYYQKGWKI